MRTPPFNFSTRQAAFLLLTATAALAIPRGAAAFMRAASALTTSIDAVPFRPTLGSTLAQQSDSAADDKNGVSSDQLEKYIAVYRDMQHDRGLTVESAAAKESLSISQFRELEQKIERDDFAREHVRTELQKAAITSPAAGPAKN